MLKVLLWFLLLALCWPLALLFLVLWPLIWLLSLPLRLAGIVVESVFKLVVAIFMLPARLVSGMR